MTGVAVVLLMAAVAFRLQQRLRLDQQITIGPETTVVEGPLAADGLVDYVAAVNELQSEGVTPENNAVVLLIEAFGPAAIPAEDRPRYYERLGIGPPPVSGGYIVEPSEFIASRHDRTASEIIDERHPFLELLLELGSRPWSRVEHPDAAALLDSNAGPLEGVVEASTRARWYSPLVGSETLYDSWTPLVAECCIAVRLLTVRSMLRLEEGKSTTPGMTCSPRID
jgi:hypothetical protein